MAERCHQYQDYQQKKVYLDQADRLSIILSELSRYTEDAKAYRDKIYALRMRKRNSRSQQHEAPETPKRNGEAPLFVGTLKDRFMRQPAVVAAQSREKQPQSSRENRRDKATKTTTCEVRFQNEEDKQEKTVKSAKPSEDNSNEITSILKNPTPKDQSDESASGTVQKVVSLVGNKNESFLTETTYI